MKIYNIFLTASLIAFCGIAQASSYVSVTGEYVASAKAKGDVSALGASAPMTFNFKDGWGGMVAVGHYLTPNVRAEVEGGYRQLKADSETITVGGTAYSVSTNAKSRALTGMGNLYYDISTGTSVTPYLGAGLGIVHKTTNGNSNALAYQGMAGINYKIDTANTVFVGYRYLGSNDLKDNYTFSGVDITDKASIRAHSIDVGYRFNF